MKRTITKQDFINEFKNSSIKDQFSDQALDKLFDYFDQLEKEKGNELEFDLITISRNYVEFNNIQKLKEEYEIPSYLSFDQIFEHLYDMTQVVYFKEDCILIQKY